MKNMDQVLNSQQQPYLEDGRREVEFLINTFRTKLVKAGWHMDIICYQKSDVKFPVVAFKSPKTLRASINKPISSFWIQGGTHGEEPAPQEAFIEEIDTIINLGKAEPIVFIPLLNPYGRYLDWRYENEYRDFTKGHSVTDSEHLLLKIDKNGQPVIPKQPRSNTPISETANEITHWVLTELNKNPPLLVLDHHEDRVPQVFPQGDPRNNKSCYVYVSGKGKATSIIAQIVVAALRSTGMTIAESGKTRFGEDIKQGVVKNANDGSIDELYASEEFYDPETKAVYPKPSADTVIVVETTIPPDDSVKLKDRVKAQREVIKQYSRLWLEASKAV